MNVLQRLIAALWFGSAVFLMLAASAAFRAAGNPTVAADVVGSMLTRWHYIALAAPLALFAMELRHARRFMIGLFFAAIVLAAMQSFVDLRIRAIRATSPVAISDLDRTDPVRRRFGMLHGVSMMLLAAQAVAAGWSAGVTPAGAQASRLRGGEDAAPQAAEDGGAPASGDLEVVHREAEGSERLSDL